MIINRRINLDLLRIFAAISVLLFHYLHRYDEIFINSSVEHSIYSYGYLGVPAFFILSGYLVSKSFLRSGLTLNFYKNRFFRIYPTYIFSMSLTFVICSLLVLNERSIGFLDYFFNLLLFSEYLGFKAADSAYWSLFIECLFYFLLPLLLIKRAFIFKLIILISFLNFFFNFYILNVLTLFHWVSFFYIGYYLSIKKYNHYNFFFLLISFVNIYLHKDFEYFFTALIIYLYIYLLPDLKLKNEKIIKIITLSATLSYPLYLIHQNIGYVILNYFNDIGFTNFTFKFIITTAIVFFLSYIVNVFDIKIMSLIKKNKLFK